MYTTCFKITPRILDFLKIKSQFFERAVRTGYRIAGPLGDAVGRGNALQAGRSWVRFIEIFHQHNPSAHTMALGLTQLLTDMSTRNISWGVKAGGA